MTDVFSPEERSRIMARVQGKNTKPEMIVRSIIHGMGYRYRLHNPKLPGRPDIVLSRHRKIVLVHGCFWHQHPGCPHADRPASNMEYWNRKLDRNATRDQRDLKELQKLGWQVLIVWECETRDREQLFRDIQTFLCTQT